MLAESESKDVRAAAYRILRHQLVEADGWRRLEDAGLHYYIIRCVVSLTKYSDAQTPLKSDISSSLERSLETRGIILRRSNVSSSSAPLSTSPSPPRQPRQRRGRTPVAQEAGFPCRTRLCGLSSASPRTGTILSGPSACRRWPRFVRGAPIRRTRPAQQATDGLLPSSPAIIDVNLLLRSNAVRVLLQCFTEGPHELASVIAPVLLQVIDSPASREGLRAGMDVEVSFF